MKMSGECENCGNHCLECACKKIIVDEILPIKTVSESNKGGEHWTVKHKRHKRQQSIVHVLLRNKLAVVKLPCQILITRIAPRKLATHDNLGPSMKWIADAICDILIPNKAAGRADDDPRIKIEYNQCKGNPKEYAVRVQISYINEIPK